MLAEYEKKIDEMYTQRFLIDYDFVMSRGELNAEILADLFRRFTCSYA